MDFSNSLIKWYLQNKRDLPWRNTRDPYKIWLSEIILQQTRVAQGTPYYNNFITAYPNVKDLANASEEEVLKLWQGLGYYSRARNLHYTAKYISTELNGTFPNNYKDLITLKGIGEYTAAAIASFAFDEDIAVVDGNVFRVLARYYGIPNDIALPKTKKEFQNLANNLLPKSKAALFNQALMEFGAIQCTPKKPNCLNCIFDSSCFALQKKMIDELPVKNKKIKIKNRYFHFFIIIDSKNNILLEKRDENDIWKNLYQPTLIETTNSVTSSKIKELFKDKYDFHSFKNLNRKSIIHKLSHQHLHIKFYEIKVNNIHFEGLSFEMAFSKPLPIVIYNFINENYFEFVKK